MFKRKLSNKQKLQRLVDLGIISAGLTTDEFDKLLYEASVTVNNWELLEGRSYIGNGKSQYRFVYNDEDLGKVKVNYVGSDLLIDNRFNLQNVFQLDQFEDQ